MSAIEKVLDKLSELGCAPRRNGSGWMARCPAHEDRNPSLKIDAADSFAGVLLRCHAGCDAEAILAGLAMTKGDLFDSPRDRANGYTVVRDYRYCDESGRLLFCVERRHPKDFRPRRPDGQYGLKGVRLVPYRLPDVVATAKTHGTVYVCEGEKDADALAALGLVSTTNQGGAKNWRDAYAGYLHGANVVVIADKDEPGRAWAARVARSLAGVAASVRVVEALVGKDVSDHLAAGHGVEELVPVEERNGHHDTSVQDDDDEQDAGPLYRRFKCWTGLELQLTTFPALRWVVPDLLPAGLALLIGAPKVGKSWAGLDIGLAVAAGGMALGSIKVDPGDVLFLALEDGPRRLAHRQDVLLGAQPASERFHAYTEWPRGVDAARAAWDWCLDHPDVRLIVVDTLARIRPSRSKGGNSYDEDTAALVPWQRLAEHFKITVVIIHHDRKADAGDFVDAVSGTHGLAGVADTTLVLDRVRMEDYGRLRLTGRDVVEREFTLRRAGPTWMVYGGPMPDPNLGDSSMRIVRWVGEQVHPVGPKEMAAALGLAIDVVKHSCSRLVDSGRLQKRSRGLYVVPTDSDGGSSDGY